MFNRQPWEIPTDLTTEEIADLTGFSTRKIKHNATQGGWGYFTAPEGTKFWDLSTIDDEYPTAIFNGIVKKDNAEKRLTSVIGYETTQFLYTLDSIQRNSGVPLIFRKAAIMCRCLEILQDAKQAMPGLIMQIASLSLAEITELDPWDLIDISTGNLFLVPLFCLDRRYWFTVLTEYVRYTMYHGPKQRPKKTDQEIIDTIKMIKKGKITL